MPTTETYEFLFRAMEENWRHARESEDKRATIANVLVVIASLTQGLLIYTGFQRSALPLTIWLIVLGVYGIATSTKLYERSQYHIFRARKLRARLDELCPDAHINLLQSAAEDEHKKHHPRLMRMRLNAIWICMHTIIAMLGIVYTGICVLK